jgi:hypothetical protein
MATNKVSGRFAIYMWRNLDPAVEPGDPDDWEYGDDRDELERVYQVLCKGRHFNYIWFGGWDDEEQDYTIEFDEFWRDEAH